MKKILFIILLFILLAFIAVSAASPQQASSLASAVGRGSRWLVR